jgi:hypothetical protein
VLEIGEVGSDACARTSMHARRGHEFGRSLVAIIPPRQQRQLRYAVGEVVGQTFLMGRS